MKIFKIPCRRDTQHIALQMTMAARIPLLLCLCSFATAEIRSFSGIIEAASSYIHYSEGYLVAPGYVDLSDLKFSTLDYVVDEELVDDEFEGEEDDDFGGDDSAEGGGGDDGGGDRMVDENPESDGSVVSDPRMSQHAFGIHAHRICDTHVHFRFFTPFPRLISSCFMRYVVLWLKLALSARLDLPRCRPSHRTLSLSTSITVL